ncbi:MAG: hypothetical protein JJT90_15700, partial [Ectothiorhodospiraceae bacterium]|nr:hypothetical protein [Ectothiorhodospiraceae bacterium]
TLISKPMTHCRKKVDTFRSISRSGGSEGIRLPGLGSRPAMSASVNVSRQLGGVQTIAPQSGALIAAIQGFKLSGQTLLLRRPRRYTHTCFATVAKQTDPLVAVFRLSNRQRKEGRLKVSMFYPVDKVTTGGQCWHILTKVSSKQEKTTVMTPTFKEFLDMTAATKYIQT